MATPAHAPPPNDFVTILQTLDDGSIASNLTEQLRRIVLGVLDTGKKGSVSLTIGVSKEGKMLLLEGKVSAKVPQPETESTMFYADKQGYLRRDDPAQGVLKDVPMTPPTPLRSVGEKRNTEEA